MVWFWPSSAMWSCFDRLTCVISIINVSEYRNHCVQRCKATANKAVRINIITKVRMENFASELSSLEACSTSRDAIGHNEDGPNCDPTVFVTWLSIPRFQVSGSAWAEYRLFRVLSPIEPGIRFSIRRPARCARRDAKWYRQRIYTPTVPQCSLQKWTLIFRIWIISIRYGQKTDCKLGFEPVYDMTNIS